MEYNIVISGVGGQGILLTSKVIGQAALKAGYKVRVGEIHGMSQREGSVIAYVRFGDEVHGSMVPHGKGDLLLSLEPLEALRYANYMKEESTILMNSKKNTPTPVELGEFEYPEDETLEDRIKEFGNLIKFNAEDIASEAGNKIATNTVMVGALKAMKDFPLDEEMLKEAIKDQVPEKALDINMKAFDLGKEEITKHL